MKIALATAALLGASVSALAPGLELALSVDRPTQGIAFSAEGRKFLSQRFSTTVPPQVVELLADNATTSLFPDTYWNSYNASDPASNAARQFVSIDGARIGPDNRYWVVDGGSTGVANSSKLVGINLANNNNTADRIYYFDALKDAHPSMNIDDVRFSASQEVAYLSDTAGALIILNLTSSAAIRVLSDSDSAQGFYPMMYNHTLVPGYGSAADPGTLAVGLDQIEVSPDGTYLYYQPCNGGLYKIETALLDAALTNATLAASLGDYPEPVALTPSTGGSTIDGDGNLYFSDTNLLAIWRVTPDGYASILVQDDALLWTNLMWVTADKKLWLPASQVRPGGDGVMALSPNNIFTYPIGAGPSPIDHA